jgi:hypothetical protein
LRTSLKKSSPNNSSQDISSPEDSLLEKKKNHPAKDFPLPGIYLEQKIIRRRILITKNIPKEESSGQRIIRRGIIRPYEKITEALRRKSSE